MKLTISTFATLLVGAIQATAAPADLLATRATTVYVCGDSTAATSGSNDGVTDGWGAYLGGLLTVAVANHAISARSSRSFWNEGRFQDIANIIQPGDIVIIEFGHNDVGSPRSNDNGRSVCGGTGNETCISDKTGETVHTFVYYVTEAAKLMTAKGANVILSSQTPKNQWDSGSYIGTPSRFVGYQKIGAELLGDSRVTFVDHHEAVSRLYQKLGKDATNALYPKDYTHTSPQGAKLSAQAFTQAIYQSMNGTTSLKTYVKTPVTIVY